MNRRVFLKNTAGCAALLSLSPALVNCRKDYYSAADFEEAPKTDAHVHYQTLNDACLLYAASIGMKLISINYDADEHTIDEQFDTVTNVQKRHPDMINFLGAFSVKNFGQDGFVDQTVAQIERCMNSGAKGIKLWKNIGMSLQDKEGKFVMVDNPTFAPVFEYLEKQGIPVVAHLGEPKNCWLPYDEMTVKGDLNYYKNHPQYHMYQYPEMPSHENQMTARDHILERYPKLPFVGAHIGSLEANLDEVAKRFDAFPNFSVDLAARMCYLQLHAIQNRTKTQSFLTKYSDRVLFGSDATFVDLDSDQTEKRKKGVRESWLWQWKFIATGDTVPSDSFTLESAPKEMEGLRMPRTIVDKIFSENAKRVFGC